jgi:hypothetical protein
MVLFAVFFFSELASDFGILSSYCYHSLILIILYKSIMTVLTKIVHKNTVYIQQSLNRIIESAGSSISNLSPEDIGLMGTH